METIIHRGHSVYILLLFYRRRANKVSDTSPPFENIVLSHSSIDFIDLGREPRRRACRVLSRNLSISHGQECQIVNHELKYTLPPLLYVPRPVPSTRRGPDAPNDHEDSDCPPPLETHRRGVAAVYTYIG